PIGIRFLLQLAEVDGFDRYGDALLRQKHAYPAWIGRATAVVQLHEMASGTNARQDACLSPPAAGRAMPPVAGIQCGSWNQNTSPPLNRPCRPSLHRTRRASPQPPDLSAPGPTFFLVPQ